MNSTQPTIDLTGLAAETVTVSSGDTISLGNYGVNMGMSYPYMAGSVNPWATTTTATPWATTNSTKITLDGAEADIEVNGWSLVQAIKQIQQRLNILTINHELEAEWDQLAAVGAQYRALEQQIQAKQATWDRLRAMPPPAVE
jgi:hypothetical protein